jgi:hypothetical protein
MKMSTDDWPEAQASGSSGSRQDPSYWGKEADGPEITYLEARYPNLQLYENFKCEECGK